MSKVLVFCEFSGANLKKGSLELLSAARTSGKETVALLVGSGAKAVSSKVGEYGVKMLMICDDASLENYNPSIYAPLVANAVKDSGCDVLLASSSMLARDLFPRVAAQLDTGIASDCTDLEISTDKMVVKKPLYAGKCKAQVEFHNSPIKIVLMRPNQLPVQEPSGDTGMEVKELSLPSTDTPLLVKEVKRGDAGKIDLTEANIIISGGRGMKGPENFKLLEEMAAPMGATVGASRAVTDAGWVPHSMQVGQTGKTVAPTLYIACGISGAIQHLAGMSGSKVIVAINQDPDAPIFQKATYGIVGDLFELAPKITEELKEVLS